MPWLVGGGAAQATTCAWGPLLLHTWHSRGGVVCTCDAVVTRDPPDPTTTKMKKPSRTGPTGSLDCLACVGGGGREGRGGAGEGAQIVRQQASGPSPSWELHVHGVGPPSHTSHKPRTQLGPEVPTHTRIGALPCTPLRGGRLQGEGYAR